MDEACVSQLIETIYSSAFEENGWEKLLHSLREPLHASQLTTLSWSLPVEKPLFVYSTNTDVSFSHNFKSYYHTVDPTPSIFQSKLAQKLAMRVFPIDRVLDTKEFIKSELVYDFLRHYDMGLGWYAVLDRSSNTITNMRLHRPVHSDEFSCEVTNLLTTLTPHLNRGLRIYREIEGLRAKAGAFEDALDAHATASFMLDAAGRVLSLNKAAKEILTGGQLTVCEGRLMARHPQDDAALQGALRPPQHGTAPAEIMLRATAHTPALRLSITPVNGGSIPLFFDVTRTARTAFLVTATPLGPTAENLITAYGLTRAEAEVSLLLLQGAKAAQIAAARETSIGTVNTQLKNIYAKLGVTGHVELLVKLMGR